MAYCKQQQALGEYFSKKQKELTATQLKIKKEKQLIWIGRERVPEIRKMKGELSGHPTRRHWVEDESLGSQTNGSDYQSLHLSSLFLPLSQLPYHHNTEKTKKKMNGSD